MATTPPIDPGSIPPTPAIPPEYQAQLADLMRKRQMAELLQMQALQQQPTQFTPGPYAHAIPTSPLSMIAKAMTAYLGNKAITSADQGIAGVNQQYATATQQEISNMLKANSPEAVNAGMASTNPQVRAIATVLQKQKNEDVNKAAELMKDQDLTGAVRAIAAGSLPGQYTAPQPKPPSFGTQGDQTYALTPEPGGKQTLSWAPQGLQIRLPGQENQSILEMRAAGLKQQQGTFDTAKNVFMQNQRAVEALQRGADAGGGGDWRQNARQVLQAFGVPNDQIPAIDSTAELKQALGKAVLDRAHELYPVSNTDMKLLANTLGSVDTDPTALSRALSMSTAQSFQAMHNFGDYLKQTQDTTGLTADPILQSKLQAMMQGQGVGREPPSQLFGPSRFQLDTANWLKKGGFNMSRLLDPSGQPMVGPGGEPPQFNIGNPGADFPAVQGTMPRGVQEPIPLPPGVKRVN